MYEDIENFTPIRNIFNANDLKKFLIIVLLNIEQKKYLILKYIIYRYYRNNSILFIKGKVT